MKHQIRKNLLAALLVPLILTLSCTSISLDSSSLSSLVTHAGPLLASAAKVADAANKANEQFTPRQEYYIGRAVAADITSMYKVEPIGPATLYLNALVQVLAAASTMPVTYGGYHVLILDTNQINALSAPGGFIFVTRGLLECTRDETSLAAVLAHEIGHIENRHGLDAIKQERRNQVFVVLGKEVVKNLGNQQLEQLTDTFGKSITDVITTMVNDGYSREQEKQADLSAVSILRKAGYNPRGLIEMLKIMEVRLKPDSGGFAKTHPSPADRIETLAPEIGTKATYEEPAAWTARFHKYMDSLLKTP